jgi:hypothetical protein
MKRLVMHRTKRRAGSVVRHDRGNVSELRDSSKFLANINTSRDLQANSAPPFVTKARQLK